MTYLKEFIVMSIFTVVMMLGGTAFAALECNPTLRGLASQYKQQSVKYSHWSKSTGGYQTVRIHHKDGTMTKQVVPVDEYEASMLALDYARKVDETTALLERVYELCSEVYSVRKMNRITFWASGGTFKGL